MDAGLHPMSVSTPPLVVNMPFVYKQEILTGINTTHDFACSSILSTSDQIAYKLHHEIFHSTLDPRLRRHWRTGTSRCLPRWVSIPFQDVYQPLTIPVVKSKCAASLLTLQKTWTFSLMIKTSITTNSIPIALLVWSAVAVLNGKIFPLTLIC